jgi:signal transduction histidine kinase
VKKYILIICLIFLSTAWKLHSQERFSSTSLFQSFSPQSLMREYQCLEQAIRLRLWEEAEQRADKLANFHAARAESEIAYRYRIQQLPASDSLYQQTDALYLNDLSQMVEEETREQENLLDESLWQSRLYLVLLIILLLTLLGIAFFFKDFGLKNLENLLAEQEKEIYMQHQKLIAQQRQICQRKGEFMQVNLELLRLTSLKECMLNMVYHDLSKPLDSLQQAFLMLNLRYIKQAEREKVFSELEKQTLVTVNSFENLIFWADRQLNGEKEIQPCLFDLGMELAPLLEVFQDQAQRKAIQFVGELPAGLKVWADVGLLKFVLRNLFSNAFKFSSVGATIRLSVQQILGVLTVISVSDQGQGMGEERITQLMQTQEFISTPGTLEERGVGLGLNLCKEQILRHGGKLHIQSTIGKGSICSVILPFLEV